MSGSTKDIKRRIRSVKNIQQITKAMETVAATKMRRSQDRALAGRAYAERAFLLLTQLARVLDVKKYPLLRKKSTERQLVILIATDKGLVGGLNTNLFRKMQDFLREQDSRGRSTDFIAIGKKAATFVQKKSRLLVHEQTHMGDDFVPSDLLEITRMAIDAYTKGPYDKIIMAYTNFVSTLTQKPFIRGILPLTYEKLHDLGDLRDDVVQKLQEQEVSENTRYLFEPSEERVLQDLLPRMIEAVIYHNMLEANASEHSARMMAMKNASDNAHELIDNLTLSYNRLRQENITKELAEISAASS